MDLVFPICNTLLLGQLKETQRFEKSSAAAHAKENDDKPSAYRQGTTELVEEYEQALKWIYRYATKMIVRFEGNFRKPLNTIQNRRTHLQELVAFGEEFYADFNTQITLLRKKSTEYEKYISLRIGKSFSIDSKQFLLDLFQRMMMNMATIFKNLRDDSSTLSEPRWKLLNAGKDKVDPTRLEKVIEIIGVDSMQLALSWWDKKNAKMAKLDGEIERVLAVRVLYLTELQTGVTDSISKDIDVLCQSMIKNVTTFRKEHEAIVAKQHKAIPFMGPFDPVRYLKSDCHIRNWLSTFTEFFGRLASVLTHAKTKHHFVDLTMHQAFDRVMDEGVAYFTTRTLDLNLYEQMMEQYQGLRRHVASSDAEAEFKIRAVIALLNSITDGQSAVAACVDVMRFQAEILLSCQIVEADAKATNELQEDDEWVISYDAPEILTEDTEAERLQELYAIREKEAAAEADKKEKQQLADAVAAQMNKVAPAAVAALKSPVKPVAVLPYTNPTVRLLAQHRQQLRCFYKISQFAMTPMEMVGKGPNFLEFAKRQQVFWTDQLQWSYEMLLQTNQPDEQEVLASFYLLCLQLSTEQSVSGAALSMDPENEVTHKVNTMCHQLGKQAGKHVLKDNTLGTIPFRFPFSSPTTAKMSLVLKHERQPSAATVKEILASSIPMIQSFIDVAATASHTVAEHDSKVNAAAAPTATAAGAPIAAAAAAEATGATGSGGGGGGGGGAATAAAADASAQLGWGNITKLNALTEELTKVLAALHAHIEQLRKIGTLSPQKMSLLLDIKSLVRRLTVLPNIIKRQPDERYLCAQAIMCFFWAQYVAINLGRLLAADTAGVRKKEKDIEAFQKRFGLGTKLDAHLKPILLALNRRKGWEYIVEYFAMRPRSQISPFMLYTNNTYATAAIATSMYEGNDGPEGAKMPLSGMYEELITKYLEPVMKTVVQLVRHHALPT